MFVGLLAALIKGILDIKGGLKEIIDINQKYGRIEFFVFDLDPSTRHTVWGLVFGNFFQWLAVYGVNQTQIQRYLSVPTLRIARQ
jgi:sodium-coupled monocarboxylate transporter 8/12